MIKCRFRKHSSRNHRVKCLWLVMERIKMACLRKRGYLKTGLCFSQLGKKKKKKAAVLKSTSLMHVGIWSKIAESSSFLGEARNLDFYTNSLDFKYLKIIFFKFYTLCESNKIHLCFVF